jgi:hypothetical protein
VPWNCGGAVQFAHMSPDQVSRSEGEAQAGGVAVRGPGSLQWSHGCCSEKRAQGKAIGHLLR